MSDRLADHQHWRPEWGPGRRCLYWYLTFPPDDLAAALPDALDDLVARTAWLDAVPASWRHVTLCDVGFVDACAAVVDDLVEAGMRALREAPLPDVHLGPVLTFPSAVALAVEPLHELRRFQGRLRAGTRDVLGPDVRLVHRHRFWPHLSLGYVNRTAPAAEVETFRRDPAAATTATATNSLGPARLVLASVERRGRTYAWATEAELPLAPQAAAS